MKSLTLRFGGTMASVLTLTGVLLAGLGSCASAQTEQVFDRIDRDHQGIDGDYQGIEGTWRVTVTLKVCTTGTPMGPSFQSLLTFARGGTMTGTTANPVFLPGQRSSDSGVWKRTGAHTYSSVDEAFIIFSGGLFTQGFQLLKHSISLSGNGNSFTDEASIQFYDVNGAALLPVPGCASAIAQRLH